MMRRVLLSLLALLLPALPAQVSVGLNVNAPLVGGGIASYIQPPVIAELGVDCVRVNAILGPWSSVNDTTVHGGHTWFSVYDEIVDGFLAEGIEVYMLIGAEAVPGSSRAAYATEGWTLSYAEVFADVVEHFRDRVSVYEMFNEPNDWAGGMSAQVEPRWFAYQMQEICRAVKVGPGGSHLGDPSYQNLTLVSGPLFSHDIGGNPSPSDGYWTETRQAGINGDAAISNLDWNALEAQTGSYPYDGIGYHIYIHQETDDAALITNRLDGHLDAMWSSVTALEGTGTDKRFWISEFGWRNAALETFMSAEDAAQAQGLNLKTAFDFFRADPRVAQAEWFSLVDFGTIDDWGVYSGSNLTPGARKPAWWFLRWQGLIGDEADGNLLTNPGFETGDLTGWTEHGDTDGVVTEPWLAGIEAHSGTRFHGAGANFGQKDGGLHQRVTGLTDGETYAAGARVLTFREGGSAGDTACRVGLDPTGGTDPGSASIIWSEPLETSEYWRPLAVQATAQGTAMTIFLEHDQAAPTWNITCFDDAVLKAAESADRGVTVTPLSLLFGSVGSGETSAAQSVQIRNDGSADLTVSGVAIEGAHADQFRTSSDTGEPSLAPGAFRTVEVVFEPVGVGPRSATLTITTDDAEQPTTEVALSGTGASSQVLNCVEFAPSIESLSTAPSADDLLHGLQGQVVAGGFHPAVDSSVGDLTDGITPENRAVTADFSHPALAVAYDLGSVQPIGEIRVFTRALDGRVFQNWSVEFSDDGVNWTFIDDEVISEPDGSFPTTLENQGGSLAGAAFTCLAPAMGETLGNARHLRFVFHPVSESFTIAHFENDTEADVGATIAEVDVLPPPLPSGPPVSILMR